MESSVSKNRRVRSATNDAETCCNSVEDNTGAENGDSSNDDCEPDTDDCSTGEIVDVIIV